ncbi:MAG: hypothetical protein K2K72_03240 [Duncaniella sp.]|nr:hypothetical protein [Duncaniella sp.]
METINIDEGEWTLSEEEAKEIMSGYPDIWLLTDTYETEGIYAELDEGSLQSIAEKVFDVLEDEDDEYAPKSVAETIDLIKETLGDGDCAEFNIFTLEKQKLLLMPDEEGYKVKRGDKIWEIARKYTGGCDNAYMLAPQGFYLLPHEGIGNPLETVWIERTVK